MKFAAQAAHGWKTSLKKFGNSANQFWIAYAENYCQNRAKRATLSASKGKYNKHWSQSNKLHIKSMAIKWPLARHRQMFAQKRKGGRQRKGEREWEWETKMDTHKLQDMRGEDTCCSCQKVTTIRHTLGMPSKADCHPTIFFFCSSSSCFSSLCGDKVTDGQTSVRMSPS